MDDACERLVVEFCDDFVAITNALCDFRIVEKYP